MGTCLRVVLFLSILHICYAELKENKLSLGISSKDDDKKFNIYYYIDDQYAQEAEKSPLLIHFTYGDSAKKLVEGNQKFIFSVAKELKAYLLVLEHRYFGESVIGEDTSLNALQNLDPKKAMVDFKAVFDKVKGDQKRSVIVSGIDYAGELATAFRIENKEDVLGSLISNSPLRLHQGGGLKLGEFDNYLNKIYEKQGCKTDKIKTAISVINGIGGASEADKAKIVKTLNLDSPEDGSEIADARRELIRYIHEAYVGLAQQNLDVKHSLSDKREFGKRPLKDYCEKVNKLDDPKDDVGKKVEPIRPLLDIYYGISGDKKHDVNNFGTQGKSNDYFVEDCQDGSDDNTWKEKVKVYCKLIWSGFNIDMIKPETMKGLLNDFKFGELKKSIYIDGDMDPNQVGRFKDVKQSDDQYAFLIPGASQGAHFLDPTTCDPNNVKQARYRAVNILKCWLGIFSGDKCTKFGTDLDQYEAANDGDCKQEAYPWGQTQDDGSKSTQPGGNPKTSTPSSALSTAQLFVPLLAFAFILLMF